MSIPAFVLLVAAVLSSFVDAPARGGVASGARLTLSPGADVGTSPYATWADGEGLRVQAVAGAILVVGEAWVLDHAGSTSALVRLDARPLHGDEPSVHTLLIVRDDGSRAQWRMGSLEGYVLDDVRPGERIRIGLRIEATEGDMAGGAAVLALAATATPEG